MSFLLLQGRKHFTCHGVSTLVRQGVDGLEQISSSGVTGEGELRAGVCAVLNHGHPGLILADVEGAGQRGDEASDVLEVFSPHTPGAVHQEN